MFLFHVNANIADIYDEVTSGFKALGLKFECCGGGRINHNSKDSNILVYGYSMVSLP